MTRRTEAYARAIVAHPWRVIALWLGLVLVAVAGPPRLEFNNNHRLFFSPDNPELVAFNRLEQTFSKNDTLNFVVEPADGTVFSAASLRLIAALTTAAWQVPYVSRVDSLTNFQHTTAAGDDLIVQDLVPDPAADLDAAALARLRAIALAEPLLRARSSGRTRASPL